MSRKWFPHRLRARKSRQRGKASGFGPRVERLERRQVMAGDFATALIEWQGEELLAIRDSYIVQLPGGDGAASGISVPDGWTSRSLGFGLHHLVTPGASVQDVTAWATGAGITEISPETALQKAALTPSDTYYPSYQWGLDNTGTPTGGTSPEGINFPRVRDADIDMNEAWNFRPEAPFTGTTAIVVAVLDDGIDYRHPDLQANIWDRDSASVPQQALVNGVMTPVSAVTQRFGYDSSDNSLDDRERPVPRGLGAEGYTTLPWEFGTTNGINNSHGTHIAGIIGAHGGDGSGPVSTSGSMVGVNWDVKLYAAKIFGENGLYAGSTALLDAAQRIVSLKRDFGQNFVVANASFNEWRPRGVAPDPAMVAAINLLAANDILFVTAAGNGRDPVLADGVGDKTTAWEMTPDLNVYPANIGASNVIAVASSTARDTLSRFSNWGPSVHIAAPGENIWSTVPRSATRTGTYPMHEFMNFPPEWFSPYREEPQSMVPGSVGEVHGGYASMSGTSMSAAYVSGVAAFVAGHYLLVTKSLPSVGFLRNAILEGADDIATLTYTEQSGNPTQGRPGYHPDDMFSPFPVGAGNVPDPNPGRVHFINGTPATDNLRLNAFGSVKWAYDNLPPKITVSGSSGLEGDPGAASQIVFRYDLDKPPQGPLTVNYWTEEIPGQATPGVDFSPVSVGSPSQFVIPVGARTGTFAINVTPDLIQESNESFRVKLRMAPNQNGYLSLDFAIGVIKNDDGSGATPAATLPQQWVSVAEGDGGTTNPTIVYVPVTFTPTTSRIVTLSYRIAPLSSSVVAPGGILVQPAAAGVDFLARTGTIQVPAGSSSAQIPVRVIGDRVAANGASEFMHEGFVVEILSAQPGLLKGNLKTTVIIVDDDTGTSPPPPPVAPGVLIEALTPAVLEGDTASFRIFSSIPVANGWIMTVFYRTINGSAVGGRDFNSVHSGRVVLQAGQSEQVIGIRTRPDRFGEPTESFSVNILNVVYQQLGGNQRLVVPVTIREASASILDVAPARLSGSQRAALFASLGSSGSSGVKRSR